MPWDGTQLHVASLTDDGALADETIVAGGAAESIVQPEWLTADRILFASDQNGFWNLYSYDIERHLLCSTRTQRNTAVPRGASARNTTARSGRVTSSPNACTKARRTC